MNIMVRQGGLLILILIQALPEELLAQTNHKAGGANTQSPACVALQRDYDQFSKRMAANAADEGTDNSAIRSTMRETANGNILNQAQMTLDLMRSNGCKMPDYAPSASRYGLASLRCASARQSIRTKRAMDRLTGARNTYDEPSECNTENWKPDGS